MGSSEEEINKLEGMGDKGDDSFEFALNQYKPEVVEVKRRYVKMAAGRHGNGASQSKIDVTPDGNQAREKLVDYFKPETNDHADNQADHLLAWLWTEGYKIVPLEKTDG